MPKEYDLAAVPTQREAIVVAHTHWDREWYATFEQFRVRLVRLIDKVVELLEAEPQFLFFTLDGQTIVLEDYLAIRPEAEPRLRALVQSGRLLIGPWYVLPDEFLVSGEALVRNLMLGAQVGAPFGSVMQVGYVPDPFGHIAQLPQILAGFGIDSFIFSRGLGDEGEYLGSEFMWQAPDGTAVLAVHQIGWDQRGTGYLNASSLGYPSPWAPQVGGPDLSVALSQLDSLSAKLSCYARTPYLLLNNGCDHLEPQPELPVILGLANSNQIERQQDICHSEYPGVPGTLCEAQKLEVSQQPERSAGEESGLRTPGASLPHTPTEAPSDHPVSFQQGTFAQYVSLVRGAGVPFQTLRGELRRSRYSPLLSGVLSARVHLKQQNSLTQTLLERWAEPFSAIAWLEGADYPAAFLWRAWRYLLANHPHDSICGCSVDQVHAEMMPRFAWSQQLAEHFTGEALQSIAVAAEVPSFPEPALPVVVFNPLGWPRSDLVTVTLDLPERWADVRSFCAVSPDGKRLSCDVLRRRRHEPLQAHDTSPIDQITVAFIAENVPAVGYRLYGLFPNAVSVQTRGAQDQRVIENAFYKVAARPDGSFDITHKPTGHRLVSAFVLEDAADVGDEYTFAPLGAEVPLISANAVSRSNLVRRGAAISTIETNLEWSLPEALAPDRKARSAAHVHCPVQLQVSLLEGIDRLDVTVSLDNAAADHRLRLLLPTGIAADKVSAAGHFAVLDRAIALPDGKGWTEQPSATNHFDGFVAVSDGRRGVALIADDVPEYEPVVGGDGITLAVTLLRCVGWLSRDDIPSRPGHAGPGMPTPGAQCQGRHEFSFALHVHAADWLQGGTYRSAIAHKVPLKAVLAPRASSYDGDRDNERRPALRLPASQSFLTVEGEGLVLSALKRSEDGRWLVVRLYNAGTTPALGRLRFYRAIVAAALLRLDEREEAVLRPADDGSLPFEAPAGRIMTFGVRLSASNI